MQIFYYIDTEIFNVLNNETGGNIMNNNLDNQREHETHKHSPLKHMLHMIICCGLPIVIIFSLPFIARFSPGGAGILGIIAPFICPIMMCGMMFMMFRGKKKESCCDDKKKEIN